MTRIHSLRFVFAVAITFAATPLFAAETVAPTADQVTPLKVGEAAPDAELLTLANESTTLAELLKGKTTVLVFFRGGWCPYCSKHLASLGAIKGKLNEQGVQLLAISPDTPESMKKAGAKHDIDVTLLSDSKYEAAQRFGVAFQLDAGTLKKYAGFGIKLQNFDGVEGTSLPVPAVFVINKKGEITFVHHDPNYRARLSADKILEAVQ